MLKFIIIFFLCFLNINNLFAKYDKYSKFYKLFGIDFNSFYINNSDENDKLIKELILKLNFDYKNFYLNINNRYFDKRGNDFDIILKYENDFNTIEFGNIKFASQNIQVGVNNLVRKQKNFIDYYFFIPKINNFILLPTNIASQNFNNNQNMKEFYKSFTQEKFSYYFYDLNGFNFGVSFEKNFQSNKNTIGEVIDYGFNYNYYFDSNIIFDFSITGQNSINYNEKNYGMKFNSNDFGLNLSYLGFSIGYNFGIMNSEQIQQIQKVNSKNDGYYNSVGVGYEIMGVKTSLSYFNSRNSVDNIMNELNSVTFNIDYKYNKLLNFYTSYIFLNTRTTKLNNNYNIFIFGINIIF